ncbi:MAG: Flp family type IVb pilin [Pirellulales bacterium]
MLRQRTLTWIRRFLQSEDGPTAVEYAVMLSLIVGVCIGAVRALSTAAADSFNNSSESIQDAMGN